MPTFDGPDLALPWSSVRDEDTKYRKLLIIFLSVFLVFAIVIPWVSVPELSREDKEEIPENLARLLLEEQEIPEPIVEPTPPVIQDEIPEPEPEPEPEPVQVTGESTFSTYTSSAVVPPAAQFVDVQLYTTFGAIVSSCSLTGG